MKKFNKIKNNVVWAIETKKSRTSKKLIINLYSNSAFLKYTNIFDLLFGIIECIICFIFYGF